MIQKNLTVIILILGILAACTSQPEVNTPLKIGVIAPLSGGAAEVGTVIVNAMQLGAKNVNANNGVNGRQVQLVIEDGKCNPKDATSAAQKLIQVDDVKMIIGGVCSGETLGAAPVAEAAKVLLFSPSSSSPDITTAGDYVFRNTPSDIFGGKIAAEQAVARGYKRVAIMLEDVDYSRGVVKVFKQRLTELGGTVVAEEVYSSDVTALDMRTQALKIASTNPEAVYLAASAPAVGILALKQLREIGVTAQVFAGETMLGRDLIKEQATLEEGLIGVEQKFDVTIPETAAFAQAYEKEYGALQFPAYQAGAYEIVKIYTEGLAQFGEHPEQIKNWLYTIKDRRGATGSLTLDSNGDAIVAYSVEQVRNGTLVVVS